MIALDYLCTCRRPKLKWLVCWNSNTDHFMSKPVEMIMMVMMSKPVNHDLFTYTYQVRATTRPSWCLICTTWTETGSSPGTNSRTCSGEWQKLLTNGSYFATCFITPWIFVSFNTQSCSLLCFATLYTSYSSKELQMTSCIWEQKGTEYGVKLKTTMIMWRS